MRPIIHISRFNLFDVFTILLICIFFILVSVLISTAGEAAESRNDSAKAPNLLISFSEKMDRKTVILPRDDGTALQVSTFADGKGFTRKIRVLFNRCIRYFKCRGSRVKLNAFNINTGHFDTSVNAVYNHEDKNVEIGMSSDSLNRRLGDDVEMEFLADPAESSAALMFSIKI